jgi:hypothetical protein
MFKNNVVPDEHAKGLLVAHLHEQGADQEAQTLTVADLVVVQTKALEHAAQHLLSLALRVLEHLDAGKTSAEILVDDVLVRAGLAAQRVVLVLDLLVTGARCTLPDNAAQWCWNTAADLVQTQCGQALDDLGVVAHEGGPELEFGHGWG